MHNYVDYIRFSVMFHMVRFTLNTRLQKKLKIFIQCYKSVLSKIELLLHNLIT